MRDDRRSGLRHQQHLSASAGSEPPPTPHSGVASRAAGARMLRLREVMEIVGLKRTYIYQLQKSGLFPRAVKLGVRAVGWVEADVRAWLAERTKTGEAATIASTSPSQGLLHDEPRSGTFPVSTYGQVSGYFVPAHEYEELQTLRDDAVEYRRVRALWAELSALLTDPKIE